MEFLNDEMKNLVGNMSLFDERLESILKERTTILATDFIEFDGMFLWNEDNRTIEQFRRVRWDYRMKLWDNIITNVEFFGWNNIELNDHFSDLSKYDIVSIGYFCFQYWKKKLKKEFPNYYFFLRFYFQEYDDGDIESRVSFHKIRFNEKIGASDLLKTQNPAVMYAIV